MRVDRKITAIEPQKRHKERLNIHLDGEYAFSLDRLTAIWLQEGQTLSSEDISRLQQKDVLETAYRRALHLLSFRARSSQEMERFLQDKGYSPDQVAQVNARLQEEGYLNDQRFAEDWINNRVAFRPRSGKQIYFELLRKGINRETADEALGNAQLDEDALALEAGRKHAGRYARLDKKDFMLKLGAALARRGFNFEAAKAASKQLWQELEQDKR
ncbi:MAG TPA: RecX family transcriptional regulator [Anaerolineaceae bacterium]|nr:RecX family transcriptional regulator [Anaerolineaceae bacterium]